MGRRRAAARKERLGGAAVAPGPALDAVESLIARARKQRAQGDLRRALVLLRQACALDEWRARSWTLLGALLTALGGRDEAVRALRHARWLRQRAGEVARAAVTGRLLEAA